MGFVAGPREVVALSACVVCGSGTWSFLRCVEVEYRIIVFVSLRHVCSPLRQSWSWTHEARFDLSSSSEMTFITLYTGDGKLQIDGRVPKSSFMRPAPALS